MILSRAAFKGGGGGGGQGAFAPPRLILVPLGFGEILYVIMLKNYRIITYKISPPTFRKASICPPAAFPGFSPA